MSSTDPQAERQTQQQTTDQQPWLDYLNRTTVASSLLPDAERRDYLKALKNLNVQFSDPFLPSQDMFGALMALRELTIHFYKQAGVEGEVFDASEQHDEVAALTAKMKDTDFRDREEQENGTTGGPESQPGFYAGGIKGSAKPFAVSWKKS